MGDTWPYGPPAFETWNNVYAEAFTWFANSSIAATFAAIASAESGLDYTVVNNTPSTGDLSVGLWQINYYNGLYSSRAAEFGTPAQLVQGGLSRQFVAARSLYSASGFTPWSTYNNGAYRNYLHGYSPASGGNVGGTATVQLGSTGTSVTTLQNDLDQLGYNLSQDGVFGPLTQSAVIAFQRAHGLATDGVVGPLTWAAIKSALPAQSPLGGPAVPPPPTPVGPPPAPTEGNIHPTVTQAWSDLGYVSSTATTQQLASLSGYAAALRSAIR